MSNRVYCTDEVMQFSSATALKHAAESVLSASVVFILLFKEYKNNLQVDLFVFFLERN